MLKDKNDKIKFGINSDGSVILDISELYVDGVDINLCVER